MLALSMEVNMRTTKAGLARKLRVSPAYVTMLLNGKRKPSTRLQKRINKLKLTDEFNRLTLDHGLTSHMLG